jgi:phosphodiesterase/alkaline phosphatase D-like protein
VRNGIRQISVATLTLGVLGGGAGFAFATGNYHEGSASEWVYGCSRKAPTVRTGTGTPAKTTATLAGNVDPNKYKTNVKFVYGTSSSSLNKSSTTKSAGSGDKAVPVTVAISGLTANRKYYYRVVASSSAGTTDGTVRSFTTTR